MKPIFKKELWSYLGSYTAWTAFAAFSLVSAAFLFFFSNDFNLLDIGAASLQSYFVLAPWILMFVIPALTMRSIAEEQQTGTLQFLFTLPVKLSDIVLGKFFAVWLIGLLCLLPSLMHLCTIHFLGIPNGNWDFGATFGSYLGLTLLTGAFSALGILCSALSSSQVLAYLLGLLLCFTMYFGIEQLANFSLLGSADFFLRNLGFYYHFQGFTRGLIDSRDLFYFVLMILLNLLLAGWILKRKK